MDLFIRIQAKDGTRGTVTKLRSDGADTIVEVEWDEWQDWCYPEYDKPTTYEFLSNCTIRTSAVDRY
jgi:hypothetical protein